MSEERKVFIRPSRLPASFAKGALVITSAAARGDCLFDAKNLH